MSLKRSSKKEVRIKKILSVPGIIYCFIIRTLLANFWVKIKLKQSQHMGGYLEGLLKQLWATSSIVYCVIASQGVYFQHALLLSITGTSSSGVQTLHNRTIASRIHIAYQARLFIVLKNRSLFLKDSTIHLSSSVKGMILPSRCWTHNYMNDCQFVVWLFIQQIKTIMYLP